MLVPSSQTPLDLSKVAFHADPSKDAKGEDHKPDSGERSSGRGRGPNGSQWGALLAILGGLWGVNLLWNKPKGDAPDAAPITTPLVTSRSVTPEQFIAALTSDAPTKMVNEVWDYGQFSYSATVPGIALGNQLPKDFVGPPAPPSAEAKAVQEQIILRGILPGTERSALLKEIEERGFTVLAGSTPPMHQITVTEQKTIATELYYPMAKTALTIGLIFGALAFLARRAAKSGVFSLPGSDQKGAVMKDRPSQRFKDVGGCDEVVEELKDVVAAIKDYQEGKKDIPLVRGVLLEGEPGTGKTLLARAIAGETECAFVSFNSGDLSTEIFVGTGTRAVRQAFELARKERDALTATLRKTNPKAEGVCIIFLDEFDSIGRKRVSNELGGDREASNIVNALLAEMDNLDQERNRGIVIVAATNKMRELDPALLRPGRFPRKINVPLPESAAERLDILKKLLPSVVFSKGMTVEDESVLGRISRITPRKSGDDMRELLTIAADIARQDRRMVISYGDLFEAYQRHLFGRVKQIDVSDHARALVTHHENGHAVLAIACDIAIMLISMKPRGGSLGRVVPNPAVDSEILPSKKDILSNILVLAGGRAEERLMFGDLATTTGAYGDIQMVRDAVKSMISSGLLAENYAVELTGSNGERLSPEHIKLIDAVATRAFRVAEEILGVLGKKRLEEIVGKLRSLDRELVDEEAQRFYREALTGQEIEQLRKVAARFFESPLGEQSGKEKATGERTEMA